VAERDPLPSVWRQRRRGRQVLDDDPQACAVRRQRLAAELKTWRGEGP